MAARRLKKMRVLRLTTPKLKSVLGPRSLSDCLFLSRVVEMGYGKDGAWRLGKRMGRVFRFPTTPATAGRV